MIPIYNNGRCIPRHFTTLKTWLPFIRQNSKFRQYDLRSHLKFCAHIIICYILDTEMRPRFAEEVSYFMPNTFQML